MIYLRAQSAFGQGKNLEWLAQTTVAAAGQPVPSKPNYRPTLAGMTAGWPAPPPLTSGGVGFHSRLCKPTRSRVDFSRQALSGGAASQLGDDYECAVPRSMLVRIRAVFREPTELELDRSYTSANGRVVCGQIAVTTLAADFVKPTALRTAKPFGYPQLRALGATKRAELAVATLAARPIAYASTAGAKTARVFISTDCQED